MGSGCVQQKPDDSRIALLAPGQHMDNQDSFWQLILHAQAHFNHPMHCIPPQKETPDALTKI